MPMAYVLLTTEADATVSVLESLKKIDAVKETYRVYGVYDIIATVTALTAQTIFNAYREFIFPVTKIDEVIIGGGGGFNPVLMGMLRELFGEEVKVLRHEDFGISDKFKEAIAFAMLAYATHYRIPNNVPSCTGARHPAVLGKVCYP